MKAVFLLKLFVLVILTSVISYAGNITKENTKNYDLIEQNLLEGLKSDNLGLKCSCAFMLGEIKSEKAVIPLMKILRDGEQDCVRLMAALSLMKIDNPRGLYMVKSEAKFNDSERVRKMCGRFYNAYLAAMLDTNAETRHSLFAQNPKK